MPQGTLQIWAADQAAAPVRNAVVSVRSKDRLIFRGSADENGRLPLLTLPAPPEDISLSPELSESGLLPFSAYDVSAESDSGLRTEVNDVQVYADTLSLQRISFPEKDTEINIPDPAILGGFPEKIPEAETKPMPPAGGTVVLPEPVIPEYIVVHAGAPSDSSAPDYNVGYTDYIKNVASSEIFATWPREALKANILTIISFTLNRVYTEWYRGKGYDFTITSSTAYDMAFTYGRNIFSEISDVVDEVFNIYIKRPGIPQPLLTQFCDGRRVMRRGWLSQWGSKELADKGYSAQRILEVYYGRDIYLTQADRVEGIPSSFPGTLSQGSGGAGVRTLQTWLNGISDNYPLIPKLAVDGIFGEKTREAVRLFQQIFNMPVTGVVTFAVWYRISDIYTAVKRLAEL